MEFDPTIINSILLIYISKKTFFMLAFVFFSFFFLFICSKLNYPILLWAIKKREENFVRKNLMQTTLDANLNKHKYGNLLHAYSNGLWNEIPHLWKNHFHMECEQVLFQCYNLSGETVFFSFTNLATPFGWWVKFSSL